MISDVKYAEFLASWPYASWRRFPLTVFITRGANGQDVTTHISLTKFNLSGGNAASAHAYIYSYVDQSDRFFENILPSPDISVQRFYRCLRITYHLDLYGPIRGTGANILLFFH